jgi:hypothetical protein
MSLTEEHRAKLFVALWVTTKLAEKRCENETFNVRNIKTGQRMMVARKIPLAILFVYSNLLVKKAVTDSERSMAKEIRDRCWTLVATSVQAGDWLFGPWASTLRKIRHMVSSEEHSRRLEFEATTSTAVSNIMAGNEVSNFFSTSPSRLWNHVVYGLPIESG